MTTRLRQIIASTELPLCDGLSTAARANAAILGIAERPGSFSAIASRRSSADLSYQNCHTVKINDSATTSEPTLFRRSGSVRVIAAVTPVATRSTKTTAPMAHAAIVLLSKFMSILDPVTESFFRAISVGTYWQDSPMIVLDLNAAPRARKHRVNTQSVSLCRLQVAIDIKSKLTDNVRPTITIRAPSDYANFPKHLKKSIEVVRSLQWPANLPKPSCI
jgi:hypothetical protein